MSLSNLPPGVLPSDLEKPYVCRHCFQPATQELNDMPLCDSCYEAMLEKQQYDNEQQKEPQ